MRPAKSAEKRNRKINGFGSRILRSKKFLKKINTQSVDKHYEAMRFK